jgi:hypothetical protein
MTGAAGKRIPSIAFPRRSWAVKGICDEISVEKSFQFVKFIKEYYSKEVSAREITLINVRGI